MNEIDKFPEFEFDEHFQKNLLALLVTKPTFISQHSPFLKPEHFTKLILADLYEQIVKHWRNNSELVTEPILKDLIRDFLKQSPNKPAKFKYLTIIQEIFSRRVKEEEKYTTSQVTKFIVRRVLNDALLDYAAKGKERPPEEFFKTINKIEKLSSRVDREQMLTQMQESGENGNDLIHTRYPAENFYIGRGLLPQTGYLLFGGLAKRGKSTLALQMSLSLVAGFSFLNFPVAEKVRVLYVTAEGTKLEIQQRLRPQLIALRLQGLSITDEDLKRFRLQIEIGKNLLTKDGQQNLELFLEEHHPQVVFIDPVAKFAGGANTNKLEFVTAFVEVLGELGDKHHCCWVLIHHYKKPQPQSIDDSMYKVTGSAGWANYCQTFMGLSRASKGSKSKLKLDFEMRHAEAPLPMNLWFNGETHLLEMMEVGEAIRKETRPQDIVNLLRELKGAASWREICQEAKVKFDLNSVNTTTLLKSAQVLNLVTKTPGKRGIWKTLN